MNNIHPILLAIGAVLLVGILAWSLWDDLMLFLDPRGQHEQGLRRGGLSDRTARTRVEGTSPIFYGLVSVLGLLGLLFFFF
jgi:hypothetical protein